MENSTLCNDNNVVEKCYSSTLSGTEYSSTSHCCTNRMNFGSCPRSAGGVKLTFFRRCLVILFLQIGCLALDHSTTELAYEEDEMRLIVGHQFPVEPSKLVTDNSDPESQQSHGNTFISFHPKFYDFKDSPVGMPRLGIVRVDNRLKDENLKLISISGNTVHFHSSFFADKIIGPGGNTTFEVVFLSRSEGQVESHLYIHTSKGMFKYHVRGFGLPNPYRLRPLVGARIPVNGSYEPLITMHNPHKTKIQVVEMLSSGTDFQLKLPDEGDEGSNDEGGGVAWAIEPFQTKQVMKGSFQGKTEGNHTGYIKIKVNGTLETQSEYLLVPVEVQVSSALGIYSPQDSLDFGHLVQSDKPKTLSLFLINAQRLPVNILSVSVKGDANSAIRIEFRPLTIDPDISASTVIALVTFDASQIHSVKQTHGLIEIRSECGQSITVPFRATVLQGDLQYNASSLGFFVEADNNVAPRNFSVRNNFSTSVAIYEVAVSHPEIVRVQNFNKSNVIVPGEQRAVFTLNVNNKAELCDSPDQVLLTVRSNITNLRLPITCYDGKLQLHTVEQDKIDFGVVEMHTTITEYFSVDNKNPVEIRLKSWGSNSSTCNVDLVGMQKGVKEDLAKIKDFDNLKKSLFLQPNHMAVFSIEVRRPTSEGIFWGESYVTTDHNQTLHLPFRFAISKGSVHSDVIYFDKAFPGKISSEKLHLSSTFNHTVSLRGLKGHHSSSMWFTPSALQDSPEIFSHRKNYVGKIHFDTRKFCASDCYSGFLTDSAMGKEWVKGVSLNWETGVTDWEILSTLQKRYESVKDTTVSNVSLWLETTEVSGYKVATRISYTWPRLSSSKMIVFPLTALGNESIIEIPISNPSSFPLVVQALLATQYGPLWTQFVQGVLGGGNTTEGHSVFFLDGVSSSSSHSNSSVIFAQVQKQLVQDILCVTDSPGVSFFLPPGAKFLLRTKFKPLSKDVVSTVILLRNNLTGVEPLWIKGRAGTGLMTVGNGTPGSSLLFQLTEKLLQACQSEPTNKYVQPQLTVRRSFLARNVGEIPLDIEIMEVFPPQTSFWPTAMTSSLSKGDACEGYGFRILNCHPFTLQPNQTHSIDIAFTPDFTMAKIVRSLRLTDSTGGLFNYSLVAMVPSGMLGICSAIISRPSWEPILKYLLIVGIILGFIAAALMAYFEAGSVVSSTVVATVRVVPTETRAGNDQGAKVDAKENISKLDLKAVYDKVDNRFKRNQKEMQSGGVGGSAKGQSTSSSSSPPTVTSTVNSNTHKQSTSSQQSQESGNNVGLRNRKKKLGTEVNCNSNASKTSEKTNKASLNLSDVSKGLDDIACSSNNTNSNNNVSVALSKKDKENVTMTGKKKKNYGNVVSSSNTVTNQQPLIKKRSPNQSNNENNFSFGILNKSSKTEEETSSTTTESSNPDDITVNVSNTAADKERKFSGKIGANVKDSSGATNGAGVGGGKRKKEKSSVSTNNNSKENSFAVKETPLPLGITSADQTALSKTYNEDSRKKTVPKKKDLPFTNNAGRGSISPKPEVVHWDSQRPLTGEDMADAGSTSEAFVIQRPAGKRNEGVDCVGMTISNPGSTNIRNACSPNGHNMPSNISSMQYVNSSSLSMVHPIQPANRVRGRPGVIGQPRITQQNNLSLPSQMHHNSISYNSGSGSNGTAGISLTPSNGMHRITPAMTTMSTMGNTMHMTTARQHTPPALNSNGIPVSTTKWHGSDILPDNGCDIWKRILVDNSPQYRTYSDHSGNRPISEMNYPTSGGTTGADNANFNSIGGFAPPNAYTSPVSIIGNHSYSSRGNPATTTSDNTGTTLKNDGGGSVSPEGNDPSYLYNGELTTEVIQNLWHLNSGGYENIKNPSRQGNFSAQSTTGPLDLQLSSHQHAQGQISGQKQINEQGYLQRMRSDPTPRTRTYSSSIKFVNAVDNWSTPQAMSYYGMEGAGHPPMSMSHYGRGRNNSLDATKIDGILPWTSSAAVSSAANTTGSSVPLSTSPNVAATDSNVFTEWGGGAGGVSRSSGNVTTSVNSELPREREAADIWDSVSNVTGTHTSIASKWSTSYGPSPIQTTFTDSVAVGSSRSHLTPRTNLVNNGTTFQETGFRKRVEMAQSQREVEAGLGFNPFTSDIWNQSDTNSWSGNYRYSSNE